MNNNFSEFIIHITRQYLLPSEKIIKHNHQQCSYELLNKTFVIHWYTTYVSYPISKIINNKDHWSVIL